jgi:hypothetical protein
LGAELQTVLSATTLLADKPHRLNGRIGAQRFCVLKIASGYRTHGWATRAAAIAQRFRAMAQSADWKLSAFWGRPEVTGAR